MLVSFYPILVPTIKCKEFSYRVYKDESFEIGEWLYNIFGLLFLNLEYVSNCFVDDFVNKCPINEEQQTVFKFFVETYYISKDCIYLPKLWALASSEITHITNYYDSFHVHLKNSLYRWHSPSILHWLNVLFKKIQTGDYCKLRSVGKPKTQWHQILKMPKKAVFNWSK